MRSQRRRLEADSGASSITTFAHETIITLSESDAVNVHGLRACGSIEPENADANCNGFWVCYCLPAGVITTDLLPTNFAELDNEDFLPYVWGVGCFTASNQAPYHFEFAPQTSRTCQNGARIVLQIFNTGISAGAVRVNRLLTCFTSS